jgi:hypothetical protein
MATVKEFLREKRAKEAHHLWNAELDNEGKLKINRTKAERENWDEEKLETKTSFKKEATMNTKTADKETSDALWGLFGASLCDDLSLTSEIPKSIVARFNACVSNKAPQIKSWEELRTAFGEEAISSVRAAIAQGIKVRLASKYLDLPFVMTKDVMDVTAGIDSKFVKEMCSGIKNGKTAEVVKKFGKDAVAVANIFEGFKKSGMTKLSVDDKAKKVWISFFGPYGSELVREIKRKVRADLAERWLQKNGCDSSASAYWSAYFGEYGSSWVKFVPSLIRPTK